MVQKTDRSGFIENDVFHEIRTFCRDALEWMARKRMQIAEKKRRIKRVEAPSASANTRAKVQQQIEKLESVEKSVIEKAFTSYDNAREEEVKTLRAEVQLYRTLSTAGITAATFSHESTGNPIKVLDQAIKAIERRAKSQMGEKFESLSKPITMIYEAIDTLTALSRVTLEMLSNEKRRIGKVEIHSVIRNILDTFEPFLRSRDISVSLDFALGSPFLQASEAAIESVITNFVNNSVVAIENAGPEKRTILIKTEIQEDMLILSVNDNGTGIEGIALRDIWLPGQTTSPNGTGLGLAIVKDTISDLGGRVAAKKNGVLGGAEFIIELPIIGI